LNAKSLRYISCLRPGGVYRFLINQSTKSPAIDLVGESRPMSYIGKLALWLASGSDCPPLDDWWLRIECIYLQSGVVSVRLKSGFARPVFGAESFPSDSARTGEVIELIQAELNRVFDLYCSAYELVDELRLDRDDARSRLDYNRYLNGRYRLAMRNYSAIISRFAAVLSRLM
jgi:hypothetical protein